jgi:suppressor for copper-sensitivity B
MKAGIPIFVAGLPSGLYGRPMIAKAFFVCALLVAATAVAAVEGEWSFGQKASARLVVSEIDEQGLLSGGIEIVMPEGWHTYWRSPGDAGIAPRFDFSGSNNVGPVTVLYPTPERRDDGLTVTNVYSDRVVLPISAQVEDIGENAYLSVAIELGVCAEICVPDSVTAAATVPAGERDSAVDVLLDDVRAKIPGQPDSGFAVTAVERDGGTEKRPIFRVRATVPDVSTAELFVEGPEGWASYRPERASSLGNDEVQWMVKFSRRGAAKSTDGAEIRVTLVSGGRAIEQVVTAN